MFPQKFRFGDTVQDEKGNVGTVTDFDNLTVTYKCGDGKFRLAFDWTLKLAHQHWEDIILDEMQRQFIGGNLQAVANFAAAMPEVFADALEPKETEADEEPIGGIEGVPAAYETGFRVLDVQARKGQEWANEVLNRLEPETISRLCELVKEG